MPTIWELDFYSRPVLDEKGKKLWEVLICESPLDVKQPVDGLFRYSTFLNNTEVNSVKLRESVEAAIARAPAPPDKIRFFRRQMSNMITKACEEVGIPAYASRRTLALSRWLDERLASVYPEMPNYQAGGNLSVLLPNPTPQPLPDALIGEKWAFVTLEATAFDDLSEWAIDFGESFPLALAGLAPDTPVPGLLLFSSRALPLAAWMSGLELAYVKYLSESKPPQLLLETGGSDSWILATLTTAALQQEAAQFEMVKAKAGGIHFIAVQTDPQAEEFKGFWLLAELVLG